MTITPFLAVFLFQNVCLGPILHVDQSLISTFVVTVLIAVFSIFTLRVLLNELEDDGDLPNVRTMFARNLFVSS